MSADTEENVQHVPADTRVLVTGWRGVVGAVVVVPFLQPRSNINSRLRSRPPSVPSSGHCHLYVFRL